jgi:hypothetical protein
MLGDHPLLGTARAVSFLMPQERRGRMLHVRKNYRSNVWPRGSPLVFARVRIDARDLATVFLQSLIHRFISFASVAGPFFAAWCLDVVAARAQCLADWEALSPRTFLHREVATAEATRRLHQAKDRGPVDVKPVTLDALNLTKVKEGKPTDTEVAPMIECVKSKLERDPIEKVLAAAEKEWTTIVMPTDGRLRFRRKEGCPAWATADVRWLLF